MKKTLIYILSVMMLLTMSIGLVGCLGNSQPPKGIEINSEELTDFYYVSNNSGCVITGLKNRDAKDLVIPEGVTGIHDEAFKNCEGISTITFPASLKKIGTNAFRNCINLTQVNFAENGALEEICSFAFSECTSITEIIIPKSVKTLGALVFEKSNALVIKVEVESANKPETWHERWNEYNNPVIWNCYNNKVANNGNQYVFYNGIFYSVANSQARVVKQRQNTVIANIENTINVNGINVDVVAIEEGAFENCYGLQKLYIPSKVFIIGKNIINNAMSAVCYIESISIPSTSTVEDDWNKNMTYTGDFYDSNYAPLVLNHKKNNVATDGKVYIHKDNLLYSLNLQTKEATIDLQATNIKEAIFDEEIEYNGETYTVTSARSSAVRGASYLEKLVLPSTLKTIGKFFTLYASNIEELVIPKSVETIGYYSFGYMSRLKSLKFEEGSKVKNIPEGALRGLNELNELVLPDNLISIAKNGIESKSLTALVLPETVTTLDTSGCILGADIVLYLKLSADDMPSTWNEGFFKKVRKAESGFVLNYTAVDPVSLGEDALERYKYWRYVNGKPVAWNKSK